MPSECGSRWAQHPQLLEADRDLAAFAAYLSSVSPADIFSARGRGRRRRTRQRRGGAAGDATTATHDGTGRAEAAAGGDAEDDRRRTAADANVSRCASDSLKGEPLSGDPRGKERRRRSGSRESRSDACGSTSAQRRAAQRAEHLDAFKRATLPTGSAATTKGPSGRDLSAVGLVAAPPKGGGASTGGAPAGASAARLRGAFAQVCRETTLAFILRNGEATAVSAAALEHGQKSTAQGGAGGGVQPMGSAASTAARAARQQAVIAFVERVLRATWEADTKLKETLLRSMSRDAYDDGEEQEADGPTAPVDQNIIVAMHMLRCSTPLQRWRMCRRYSSLLFKSSSGHSSPSTAHGDAEVMGAARRIPRPPLPPPAARLTLSRESLERERGAFQLARPDRAVAQRFAQQPEDLVAELATYWRLHAEAAARHRLRALRDRDAEAFAEHVSMLKISTLLGIMERTHDFMVRIGLRLKQRAQASTEDGGHGGQGTAVAVAAAPGPAATAQDGADDYQRFKAYVASTKDDFRLIHQVDTFVERQPHGLRATLLPHQLDGLRFLTSLHANGINGILADEMGVGKTIQTLAFLLHLKEARAARTAGGGSGAGEAPEAALPPNGPPHLVLAPLSVVREWREACEQFVPHSMRVAALQELADPLREASSYDILLLPIHSVRSRGVQEAATRIQWGYLVVDEAHKAVSNLETQTARAILSLPYQRRLVLTGTPLNSDLQELWSLLYFLNPDVFTDGDSFEEVFRRPFATYEASEMALSDEERGLLVLRLHQILRPFMLRRTKRDIDTTLRITFHTVICPLSAMQRELLHLLRTARRTPSVVDDDDDDSDSDSSASSSARSGSEGGSSVAARHHASKSATGAVVLANPSSYRLTGAGVSESTAQLLCNQGCLLPFFSRVLERHGFDETVPDAVAAEEGETEECGSDKYPEEERSTTSGCGGAVVTTTTATAGRRGAADTVLACSGKFLVLYLFLARLAAAGRKAVIFTHWLDCIDLLAEFMVGRGWGDQFEVLTGATSEADRKSRVQRFREDPRCLFFILSIKAGGCGINLQTAHVVVMLDRDYTMTNEDQALARVYRIGQAHTVRAIYFATDDPAEARVTLRAERKNKQRLAIIEDGNYQVGGGADEGGSCKGHEGEACGGEVDVGDETSSDGDEGGSGDKDGVGVAGGEVAKAGMNFSSPSATRDDTMSSLWEAMRQINTLAARETNNNNNNSITTTGSGYGTDAAIVTENIAGAAAPIGGGGSVRPEDWRALRQMVVALDEWVLTESDGADSTARALLEATRPPTDGQWPSEDGNSRSEVARWGRRFYESFWRCWLTAMRGPPLLAAALRAAVRNDALANDVEHQRRRRERRTARQERRLRLVVGNPPPESWWMECWERGVEDDEEIVRLFHEREEERRLERERREVARAARVAAAAARRAEKSGGGPKRTAATARQRRMAAPAEEEPPNLKGVAPPAAGADPLQGRYE